MKKVFLIVLMCVPALCTQAQFGKLKGLVGGNKKDTTETKKEEKKEDKKEKGQGAGFGSRLLSKVVTKVAKVGSPMLTTSTADLNAVTPVVFNMTNLYPDNVGVIDQSFYNGWQGGGNMVGVMFTQKESSGFAKIEGDVTIDGKPAEYASVGLYVAFSSDNSKPKTVSVTSKNGQTASFTLNPPKQSVNLVSVNGQKDNVSVDLTKEVVLELDNLSGDMTTPILVSIAANTLGLKGFYPVGYFKPASKIVIDPAFFRNTNVPPGNTKMMFNYKGCFLKVERGTIDQATNVSGVFPAVEYGNVYYDGKFINVTGEPEINPGLTSKGTEKFPNGTVDYNFYKPNAHNSRPMSEAKTVGVTAFALRGTTYYYEQTENRFQGTETTKSAQFPQFPDEVWDNILNKLYDEFIPIIESELGVSVLPIEKVTSAEVYKGMEPFSKDEANNTAEFARTYKDTKMISVFIPITDAYGINNADYRLMKEIGANALLKLTLDVRLTYEGSKVSMVPVLGVELNGEQNGPTMSTKYFTANITGQGVPLKSKSTITADMLEETIIRKSDLLAAFRKGLREIKQHEAANGDYDIVWKK